MRRLCVISSVLLAGLLMVMSAAPDWAADAKTAKDKSSNGILGKVVPVDQKFRDRTYTDLIAPWVEWYINLSVAPWLVEDPADWAENQPGKVWFLAGLGNYDVPERKCVNIPPDAAIFFPIINNMYIGWPQPPYNETPDIGWGASVPYAEAVLELQCIIDGVEVPNLFQHRVNSGGYPEWSGEVNMAAEGWLINVPGTPSDIYPGLYPFVSDGYWLLLRPLSAGKHTIQIRGKCASGVNYFGPFDEFTIDVTYDITVAK